MPFEKIGKTRKVSLTLPVDEWEKITHLQSKNEWSVSETIRVLLQDSLTFVSFPNQPKKEY